MISSLLEAISPPSWRTRGTCACYATRLFILISFFSLLARIRTLPLFRVHPESEALQHVDNIPSDPTSLDAFLAAGKTFQGGNAKALHTLLQVSSGDRLLYVGDHVYADVLRSKRTLGWRTCLIVPELTNEILAHKKSRKIRNTILELRREQFSLQNQLVRRSVFIHRSLIHSFVCVSKILYDLTHWLLRFLQDEFDDFCRLPRKESTLLVEERRADLQTRLQELRVRIKQELAEINLVYHPQWGPLFKAGLQESRFAKQVLTVSFRYNLLIFVLFCFSVQVIYLLFKSTDF